MAADTARTQFRVLGPLEVETDYRTLPLNGPQLRALVALLVANVGRAVSVAALVENLWGEQAPPDAHRTVRTYVSRLRRALSPTPGQPDSDLIVTRSPGYLLSLEPHAVDAVRFERWAAEGREALAAGKHQVAAERLRAALALWHGDPYGEFDQIPALRAEAGRLNQLRLAALADRVEADLAGGMSEELVAELEDLTGRWPGHERLWGHLLRALYRAGRQTDALAAFRRARAALVEEAGVEPSPELTRIHQQILAHDPGLRTDSAPRAVRPAVPRQLPAPPQGFVGRSRELAELTSLVDTSSRPGSTVVISAIGGSGGMGKTWFALHWAHRNIDRFPDGQLYVNLRGFDPSGQAMSPHTAVRGFLDALGVAPSGIPDDPDAQVGLYRSLVAGKRLLILADNAADSGQVIPLLPGGSSCTVLVTSRDRLPGLAAMHSAHPLPLGVLADTDARALLTHRLGAGRLAAEPDATATMVAHCAGLPLALSIVAGRAQIHPNFPLSGLAAELRHATTRLDVLEQDLVASVRAVVSWSYAALTREQARVFGLLGMARGPDIGLSAVANLAGRPPADVNEVLSVLERVSLVHQDAPGRYRLHDLIRLYARERAAADQAEDDRAAALRRLIDAYLHTAYGADRHLNPLSTPPDVDPPIVGCRPEPLADATAALAWFDAEHACLLAAQRTAATQGWQRVAAQLAWTLDTFHTMRGHLDHAVAMWRVVLGMMTDAANSADRIVVHWRLGRCLARTDDDGAADHLHQALALAEQTGDRRYQAAAHRVLATLWERRGDDRRALEHTIRALGVYQDLGDTVREAETLNDVGWHLAHLGDHEEARVNCEAALVLHRRDGNRHGEANALDSLGYIAHGAGQHAEAVERYQQALALFRDLGDAYEVANTLHRLGQPYVALGRSGPAADVLRAALELYDEQGRDAEVAAVRRQLDDLGDGMPTGEASSELSVPSA